MAKPNNLKLNCWKCGLLLGALVTPIPRYEACPECRAELHCCRMCRHYDARVIGQCRHDRAERVLKKHEANYCTFFRPRAGAHRLEASRPPDNSRSKLNELFGLDEGGAGGGETLESLFGIEPKAED